MMWEFLRPKGILHTPVTIQIAFLACFSWQRETPSCLLRSPFSVQRFPTHPGSGSTALGRCECPVHEQGGGCSSPASVQQTRERHPCFSVVTRLPAFLFPCSCPLWCFHSLLVEAELLRHENTAPNQEFVMGRGRGH